MTSVTGLLLNYRDAAQSILCIDSLLDNGAEHVVVWDNSDDAGGSARSIIKAFHGDARIDIRQSPANLGFAGGVNRAMDYCSGAYPATWILLINNDARLSVDALSKLCSALEENIKARISVPNIKQNGQVFGPGYCHRMTGLLSWVPKPGYFCYPSGCCMLLAMDRLKRPLFDEDFFMYGEDWELGWRLLGSPGAWISVGAALVEHEGAASSGLGSPFYESHMTAAHLILARKLAKNPADAFLLHAMRAGMLLMRACVRSWRLRSFVPLGALWTGSRLAFGSRRRP